MFFQFRWLRRLPAISLALSIGFSSVASAAPGCGQELVQVREVVWVNGIESAFYSYRYLNFDHWLFGCLFF